MTIEQQKLETSWMWTVNGEINALRIDRDEGVLRWYDAIGCSCDTSAVDQPLADYATNGSPASFAPPPEDIATAIAVTVAALSDSSS